MVGRNLIYSIRQSLSSHHIVCWFIQSSKSPASGDPLNHKLSSRVKTTLLTFLEKQVQAVTYLDSLIPSSDQIFPNPEVIKVNIHPLWKQSGKVHTSPKRSSGCKHCTRRCVDNLPIALLPSQILFWSLPA